MEDSTARDPSTAPDSQTVALSKEEVLQLLHDLRAMFREYGRVLEKISESPQWREQALELIREHHRRVHAGNTPLGRLSLVSVLLPGRPPADPQGPARPDQSARRGPRADGGVRAPAHAARTGGPSRLAHYRHGGRGAGGIPGTAADAAGRHRLVLQGPAATGLGGRGAVHEPHQPGHHLAREPRTGQADRADRPGYLQLPQRVLPGLLPGEPFPQYRGDSRRGGEAEVGHHAPGGSRRRCRP